MPQRLQRPFRHSFCLFHVITLISHNQHTVPALRQRHQLHRFGAEPAQRYHGKGFARDHVEPHRNDEMDGQKPGSNGMDFSDI